MSRHHPILASERSSAIRHPAGTRPAPGLLAILAGLAWAAAAFAQVPFDVSGTIMDASGVPLQKVRVKVWDSDPLGDFLIATVHTDAAGNYTATATGGWGNEDPDIYIQVEWDFELDGPYGDAHMRLLNSTNIGSCLPDLFGSAFTSKSGPVTLDHPGGNLTGKDLMMDETPPAPVETLRFAVNVSLDYYENNKGGVTWDWDKDIKTKIRTTAGTSGSFYCQANETIFIHQDDINQVGAGRTSDVYHEMGHLVHHEFGSGGLPSVFGGYSGSHSRNTESDRAFAVVEGWASYIAELTDNAPGGVGDGKYAGFRDPGNNLWRGDEAAPTGLDGTSFENGEIVEGALGGYWFELGASFAFEDNFKVMVDNDPDNIFEFAEEFVADQGGAGAAGALTMYRDMQLHGIFFSRAKFVDDPIDEEEPEDESSETMPPPEGNYKVINDFSFVRGTVTMKYQRASKGDLGVNKRVDDSQARVGYKPANAGVGDAAGGAFTNFTPPASYGIFSSTIDVDTTTFAGGGPSGFGDWDLVIQTENDHQFEDDFFPSWMGDNNGTVNTDEKYLKVLGAWYDRDKDPTTMPDKEGMVIVDNSAPEVSDFKPQ